MWLRCHAPSLCPLRASRHTARGTPISTTSRSQMTASVHCTVGSILHSTRHRPAATCARCREEQPFVGTRADRIFRRCRDCAPPSRQAQGEVSRGVSCWFRTCASSCLFSVALRAVRHPGRPRRARVRRGSYRRGKDVARFGCLAWTGLDARAQLTSLSAAISRGVRIHAESPAQLPI